MRISKTKFILLGLIMDSNLSGYDIKKIIEKRLKYFWNESFGQIYPELSKLTKEGYLEIVGEGIKGKKIYGITELGKKELSLWLERPSDIEQMRFELMVKAQLGKFRTTENFIKDLENYRYLVNKDIDEMKSINEQLKPILDLDITHVYMQKTLELGLSVKQTYSNWCTEMITLIETADIK